MITTFWITVRQGPPAVDELWYLNQIKQHFTGQLPEPEKLTMISDNSADINDKHYQAAILLKISQKWNINFKEGNTTIVDYSDKEGYSGIVISWMRKSKNQKINYDELTEAAYNGNIKAVESFLDQRANIDGKDKNGNTALIKASRYGHSDLVRYLLKKGANVNLADKNFATPLIHATCSERMDIIMTLLENGADINAKDCTGRTAEDWAEFSGYNSIKTFLHSRQKKKWYNFFIR
jgi:ankyrin repeat protein